MTHKNWQTNSLLLMLCILAFLNGHAQNLVWSDEFEIDGPINADKWHHQTLIPNGESWYNGEIQHYTNRIENSFVSDGTLKIMAIRENYTQQGITKEFTSARLNSKFAFTYGRVEVRARLPFGLGTWPAIWMLGQNITETGGYFASEYGTTPWPACGEIDIMEHWGANQNYISSATHTPSSYGGTVNVGGRYVNNVSSEFHLYSVDWDETKLTFAVDNQVHYVYQPAEQNMETWPFDLNQYLLLNVAILPEIIPTGFTQDAMEIDFVRVYQNNLNNPSSQQTALTVSRNPVVDELTIRGIKLGTSYEYILVNQLGEILYSGELKPDNPSINTSHLAQGMYLLRIHNARETQCFKIIKN